MCLLVAALKRDNAGLETKVAHATLVPNPSLPAEEAAAKRGEQRGAAVKQTTETKPAGNAGNPTATVTAKDGKASMTSKGVNCTQGINGDFAIC